MTKIKALLEHHGQKLFLAYFFLGPIFDLITSLSLHFLGTSMPLILVIKILFLGVLLIYALLVTKNKNQLIFYYGLLIVYFISFLVIMFQKQDVNTIFYQLQNLLRTFYFPLCLPSLVTLVEENKINVKKKDFVYFLLSYLLLLFIPIVTKTGFDSYAYSKEGSLGWFHSTNEISGIISILTPYFFLFLWNKNKIVSLIFCLIFIYVCFSIGTKVPILSLALTLMFLTIYLFAYLWRKNKKGILLKLSGVILSGIILLCIIVPKTSFYKNIQIHLDFLNINSFSDLMTFDHIDHFVFSSRLKFLLNTQENYENSSSLEKVFGIGYIENYATDQVNTKTIEMDYYDIFYRHGVVGTILYFLPFLLHIKRKYTMTTYLSILLIFILAFFSGHIFVAPSVSFLVAIILTRKEDLNENWFYDRQLQ